MADKKTHFGRAGEFYAMSELLLRGWNVAVPVVDLGDDVFVIDDRDKAIRRVQVKSTEAKLLAGSGRLAGHLQPVARAVADGAADRALLHAPRPISATLAILADPAPGPVGDSQRANQWIAERRRPTPQTDEQAKTDALGLTVTMTKDAAVGWEAVLDRYLDVWPDDLPIIADGPGPRRPGAVN
ncbi:hypothetical protein [Nannocystis pusilla]|uniref:hypothetical protein n=1 Tax=Nannocystis pusilla TaxID=889268 RepID=UPI003B7AC5B8